MLLDWLYSKLGMLLLVLLLFEIVSKGYSTYETHNAQREAEALVRGIAVSIAEVAQASPHYSISKERSRVVTLPDNVHGMPYLLKMDEDEYLVEVVLLGANGEEEVSARAFLPIALAEDSVFVGFEEWEDGSWNLLVDTRPLEFEVSGVGGRLNFSVVGG